MFAALSVVENIFLQKNHAYIEEFDSFFQFDGAFRISFLRIVYVLDSKPPVKLSAAQVDGVRLGTVNTIYTPVLLFYKRLGG